MSLLLKNRDYISDDRGSVASVSGGEALLNEVLFRLTARRGGFPLMPELGSRLHLLRNEKPSERGTLAARYAAEALSGLDVAVTGAAVTAAGDGLHIRVDLTWQGETLTVEVEG